MDTSTLIYMIYEGFIQLDCVLENNDFSNY